MSLVIGMVLTAACVSTDPIDSAGAGGLPSQGGEGGTSTSNGGQPGVGGSTSSSGQCGDSVCDGAVETCETCPGDCPCDSICGDDSCDPDETCDSCPADCGVCMMCGDGTCDPPTEDCSTCSDDCGVCGCASDPLEPNNHSPNASPVTLGVDYCDLSICAGDADWFKIEMTTGFTATATFVHANGDLELEVYDGQTLDYLSGSYSGDDNESVTVSGLPSGTYWARVFGASMTTENPAYCFRAD
ncbi:MAG: hypothetical protein U0271_21795 [Polyangiaceae bacterium]